MKLNEVSLHARLKQLEDIARAIGVDQPYAYMDGLDQKVDAHGAAKINNGVFERLPVDFGHALKDFHIRWCNELRYLQGYPSTVRNSASIERCEKLTTLKGLENTMIKNVLTLSYLPELKSLEFLPHSKAYSVVGCGNALKDMRGIEKHLKFTDKAGSFHFGWDEVERGGIGLVLVKNLRYMFDQNISTQKIRNFKAFYIISKYLGKPEDMYDCQAELIENGLDEFAEL